MARQPYRQTTHRKDPVKQYKGAISKAQGKLLGFPYKVSNQIATENKKTSIIFGNWADLLVGEQLGLETYTTLDGSWTDEEGNQHNAFEENLAATRALMYVDIAARHTESFIVVKNALIV